MKNKFYLLAGGGLLATALLHTIGGQITLVNPMFTSNLDMQVKSELLGAWHIVTVLLWVMGIVVIRNGFQPNFRDLSLLKIIGILNLLFGFVFIFVIIAKQQHTPQYILFFPIAVLLFFGFRKQELDLKKNP